MATIGKTTASLVLAAILLASVAMLPGRIANAQIGSFAGQDVAIKTSADDHGGRFFGEGVLQVVIKDDTRDNNNDDTIQVRIDASSKNAEVSKTFEIPNTNAGSQRFEFFLTHAQSQYADGIANDGTALDPINREGFDNPADGFDGIGAPIIRFGTDAGSGVELQTDSGLYEQVTFDIRYEDQEITIKYDDTNGQLALDREVYGTDSIVYVRIDDQDANLNPTHADSFSVTTADADKLFELNGLSFADDVVFRETGDNTAVFEGKMQLAKADTASDDPAELVFSSESASITLDDKVNYANISGPENDSNNTSSANIVIKDDDGLLDDVNALTFGKELQLTLRDNDQNKDSDKDETISGRMKVRVDNGDANGNGQFDAGEADEESVRMSETGNNSGVFVIDLANNELKITFLSDGENPTPQNGILELRKADMDKDIVILYEDPLDKNSSTSITSQVTKTMQLTAGTLDLPDSAGINDKVVLTINDPDLNDNPRTKDSYSFTLSGSSGTFPLTRGGESFGELATIEMEIAGKVPTFGTPITYTLTETEENSGVFTATLEMTKILASTGINVDDGDRISMTYNDLMAKTSRESSDTLVIARSSLAVDFSRDLLPIPPVDDPADTAPESSVGGFVGTTSKTALIVTDVRENKQPNSEDSIDFRFKNDPGVVGPSFSISVEGT